MLVDLPLPPNREQKYEGVKWLYFMHDIQASFYYWKRGQLTIRDWWKSIRGAKHDAVFSWNDPAPFWHHLWGACTLVIKGQISRLVTKKEAGSAGLARTTEGNP